jgi:nicotinate-nucleotide adenylyltransferase
MTELAAREHPRFEVSDLELRREGPSYTVDTLAALAPRGELHVLIGSETFLDLLSWKEPARVARLARLVVVPRQSAGFDPESPAARKVLACLELPAFAPAESRADAPAPVLVPAASLPISGTDLRRRAREGRSLAYRTPAPVIQYIRAHRLFGAES